MDCAPKKGSGPHSHVRDLSRAHKAQHGSVAQPGAAADVLQVTLPPTRLRVNRRGLALGILTALASVFALSWAQAFAVPLLLGIIFSYTLSPLVAWLEAIRIPRVGGTIVVMASVIGMFVFGTYSLRGQMQTIVEQLPEAATQFAAGLGRIRIDLLGDMQRV
jgi:predicted PurR-regulated permease PerM